MSKVYVLIHHGYDGTDIGLVCASKELAEETLKLRGFESYEIEEYELAECLPKRVTLFYVHATVNQAHRPDYRGSMEVWDFEVEDLINADMAFSVWGRTQEEAEAKHEANEERRKAVFDIRAKNPPPSGRL